MRQLHYIGIKEMRLGAAKDCMPFLTPVESFSWMITKEAFSADVVFLKN